MKKKAKNKVKIGGRVSQCPVHQPPAAFRRDSEGIHYPCSESHSREIRLEEERWLLNKSVVALWCVPLTKLNYICHSHLEWTTRMILV